jgi:hypothetical protein
VPGEKDHRHVAAGSLALNPLQPVKDFVFDRLLIGQQNGKQITGGAIARDFSRAA